MGRLGRPHGRTLALAIEARCHARSASLEARGATDRSLPLAIAGPCGPRLDWPRSIGASASARRSPDPRTNQLAEAAIRLSQGLHALQDACARIKETARSRY
jgi:hypothetical protein